MKYQFLNIEKCNMCEAPASSFKTLGKRLNKSQGFNPKNKIGITTTIQQCTNCKLIFANPLPIPASLQDHYGMPPESYWTESYFHIDENYFAGVLEWIKSIKNFDKNAKALDIGAGIGKSMIALERAGFKAYGIEPSNPFYERATGIMNIDRDKIKNLPIEEAQFKENDFDFITFGAVLEHLYNPSEALDKAIKWLKPGGLIQLEVPSSDWLTNKIVNRVYKLRGMDYVSNLSPMHEPFHLYEFSLQSFIENSEKHGYEIADYKYYVCDTYLPKAMDFILKPYMRRTNKGMQLAVLLRKK